VQVNGRRVDIPSFLVKPNDVIEIQESSEEPHGFTRHGSHRAFAQPQLAGSGSRESAGPRRHSKRDDLGRSVERQLIVELYSK
jgi:small subunit ribosomal protein S4